MAKYYNFFRNDVEVVNGKMTHFRRLDKDKIRIMVEAEGYAMVRKKGCMPFVIQIKDICYKNNNTGE